MKKSPLVLRLAVAAALSLSGPAAFAASATWDGDTNGNWNDSNNWSAAFPNASGETATFSADVPNSTVSFNGASILVGTISFTTNAESYTFNAGGGSLTLNTAITLNANVAGAVTQTFNTVANLNANSVAFTNNAATASLNLAGGVNNLSAAAKIATFSGSGNGGTINGLTQTGGGALSVTLNNTSGVWNITGTHTASGALLVSGVGGITRLSSDLSSTSGTTITSGYLQINNSSASGGLNATAGISQTGTLEAFGADRTINTTTHTLFASTFTGTQSLTIGSLATITAASGSITNDIGSGKSLTFNNTNFYLSDDNTSTSRNRSIGGTGATFISGNIANNNFGNTVAAGIVKNGTGTLTLSGSNSYTGTTQINSGVLRLDSLNALGSAVLVLNGGVLGLGAQDFSRALGTTAGTFRFGSTTSSGFAAYGADRNVNIGGGTSLSWAQTNFVQAGQSLIFGATDATNKVTFQNNLNLVSAERTIQVNDGAAPADAQMSGIISSTVPASGALNKTGAGTLILSNTNTYSGLTKVTGGRLLVNGSQAGAVQALIGTTLGGNGTITGDATIDASATLTPGDIAGTSTAGTLNVSGNLSLAGTLSMNINGTIAGSGYDQANVTGNVILVAGNDLVLTLGGGYTHTAGNLIFLINNANSDLIGGSLEGYTQGQTITEGGQQWTISYTGDFGSNAFSAAGGNDLVLQAVPEPSTWTALLGGIGIFVTFQILRKNRKGI